jgi:hypothetical protein
MSCRGDEEYVLFVYKKKYIIIELNQLLDYTTCPLVELSLYKINSE